MSTVEDPGWRGAARGLLFVVVPMMGARMAQRSENALVLMRQAWVTFTTAAIVLWAPVLGLWLAGGLTSESDGRTWTAVVVVGGTVLQLSAGVVVKPPVSPDPDVVVEHAQRGFFLRVALAESAALLGFVGFVVTVNPMVYGAGFVIAMAGLYDAAPTAAKLDRMQQQLASSGSDVELLTVLVGGGLTR